MQKLSCATRGRKMRFSMLTIVLASCLGLVTSVTQDQLSASGANTPHRKEVANYMKSVVSPPNRFAKFDELLSEVRIGSSIQYEPKYSVESEVEALAAAAAATVETAETTVGFHLLEHAKSHSLEDYDQLGPVLDKSLKHKVVIALQQQNLVRLEEILHEVSDPHHPKYGQYLTMDEVCTLTRHQKSVDKVLTYLQSNPTLTIVDRTLCDEFITIESDVGQLELFLNTKFFEFQHREHTNTKVIRSLEYSIPLALKHHITAIFNTIYFPTKRDLKKDVFLSKHKMPASISSQAKNVDLQRLIIPDYVTPLLLNQVYHIKNNTGNHLATQGVYETLDQNYSPSDLTLFQTHFALKKEAVAQVIGGHNSDKACLANYGQDCAEANLDIQYMMGVAQNVPATYYYWGEQDFMVAWLTQVSGMIKPPLVLSISYGADEMQLPDSYPPSFDTLAMKLGVRGVTITVSSGDDGAISSSARKNVLRCGYAPSFPATSPYVVAVGGTMGPEQGLAEVACQSDLGGEITTGGGISSVYPLPKWQKRFVEGYFTQIEGTSIDPSPGYALSGRGIPDISLLAKNYVIALGGNFTAVSGTSASSPVFAAMISLVNSARIAAGKPSVGWVTPALYKLYASFVIDITVGHNKCVASATVCCAQGFHSTQGWDPVTGLGSIDFTKFMATMLAAGDDPLPLQPTFQPTLAPIDVPSAVPTSAPTKPAGWMYLSQYEKESCSGKVTTISGVPTNRCLIEYDENQSPIGSRIYICSQYSIRASYHTSLDCTTGVVGEEEYFYGCAYKVEDYYYAPNYYSVDIQCSNEISALPPLPKYDGSYVVNSNYDSVTGCLPGTESSVDSTLQNFCFNIAAKEFSYKFVFPKVNVYEALNCRAKDLSEAVPLNTQCELNHDDDTYYSRKLDEKVDPEYYYGPDVGSVAIFSVWAKANVPPTKAPTQYPTLVPSTIIETQGPTESPSVTPTAIPSEIPSFAPSTAFPSIAPSAAPSDVPTLVPTTAPSSSFSPTIILVPMVSGHPTEAPTTRPSTVEPTMRPSTVEPTFAPSASPTILPTLLPSLLPTCSPTTKPTSAAPTFDPTQAPSMQPTLSTEVAESTDNFQMLVSHILTGITPSTWLQDSQNCFLVLTNAIIEVFPSLNGKDIQLVSVQPYQSSSAGLMLLSEDGVNVTYTLAVDLKKEGFENSGLAYYSIRDSLELAVRNGDFDSYVYHWAVEENVPLMAPVKSSGVSVDIRTTWKNNDSEGDGPGKQGWIGIIIAMSLVLILVVVSCYCLNGQAIKNQLSTTQYQEVTIDSDSTHQSSHPLNAPAHGKNGDDDEEVEIELTNLNGYSVVSNPMVNVRGRGESV